MSLGIIGPKVEALNLIDGQLVKGNHTKHIILSPYNGKEIGSCYASNAEDVAKAVKAATVAQKEWALKPMKERAQFLFKFREILMRDLDKISHLKSSESGKTFEEGRAGLLKGIEVLEYALSLQNLDHGAKMEVSRGVFCEYQRMPLGVVASITPFNFPAMVPMWTIPIAIALGNAYIWKPSDKTPLTSMYIANALIEAGIHRGVFSIIQGGEIASTALIEHPDVKAVAFVGSTKIAKTVYTKATSLGKRALCMGGAKNHIVLLPDANLDLTGPGIAASFTGCAGQRCMAASVLLAVGDCQKHIDKIVSSAGSLTLGQDMGALITRAQKDFLKDAIERAEKAGAKIILDGRKARIPSGMEEGNWLGATVLDNVVPGSESAKVELFGPIISIIRCRDLSQAMEIQNSSEYGNACSVFTSNGALAQRVASEANAGMIGINIGVPVPREPFSFGGINASKFGHGDITGDHALDFWSDVKKITTKWEKQSDGTWMS